MPIESAADRNVFLGAADFGCVVTYTPIGGVAVAGLSGLFDNDFLQADGDGAETAVTTRAPRITMRSADLVSDGREGDLILITSAPSQPEIVGRLYRCMVPRPDGTGMAVLWLERA